MMTSQAPPPAVVLCSVEQCSEIATVSVRKDGPADAAFCAVHWTVMRSAGPGAGLLVVREVPRPLCFVRGCDAGAIEVVEHLDGTALPCCAAHLEDLSWVTPERFTGGDPDD